MPNRRALLRGLAGGVGLVALDACGHRAPLATPASSSTAPRPPLRDWDLLRRKLSGDLHLPADGGYDAARRLFDRRFDGVRPAAVLGARTVGDVQQALAFARAHGLPLATRAGGHSYTGASVGSGLVLDLRPMLGISVRPGTATVAAGAALVDVYARLAAGGVSVPAGSCPAVGLAGLALGGGQGVVSRSYGLTCDRIVSMQVVLADNRVVVASAESEPDLFWALRGAGASYGVVTSFELRTHATQGLSTSYHAFPWSAAPQVLTAWTEYLPSADRSVWSTCQLLAQTDDPAGPPTVTVSCVRVGPSGGLRSALAPFLDAVGAVPTSASYRDRPYLETMLLEAGCAGESVTACHVAGQTPGGTLPRDAFVAASDFFTRPVSPTTAAAVAAAVEERQRDRSLEVGGAAFDTWGGAIADLEADATAFVHRDVAYGAQYTASWQRTPGNGPLEANRRSLATIAAAARPAATGAAYQNYADPTLPDPQRAYYGANLPRLLRVKRAYDPDGVFSPPQGITP